MIQVLHRAAALLSAFQEEPDQARTLTELTAILKVKAPTCANIVRTLVDLGYLHPIPGKRGYVLGPGIYALTKNGRFKKDLVARALPLLTELSKKTGETTLLAALSHFEKVILCQVEADQDFRVNMDSLVKKDLYATATGRVLISHLSPDDIAKLAKRHGFPGEIWGDIRSLHALQSAAEKIRLDGKGVALTNGQMAGISFPVFENDESTTAALGLFLPEHRFKGEHRQLILREMEKTAAAFSREISGKQKNIRTA